LHACRSTLEDPLIIVTPDEHNEIELGKKYKEVEDRKNKLLENYEFFVKETQIYESTFLNKVYEYVKKNTTFFNKNY
jgi:hypothetical protein